MPAFICGRGSCALPAARGPLKSGKLACRPQLAASNIGVSQSTASSRKHLMQQTSPPPALASGDQPASEDLLTPAQAASRLQIAPTTLAAWRATRRVAQPAHCRIGGAVRYRRADIDAFIEASRRPETN